MYEKAYDDTMQKAIGLIWKILKTLKVDFHFSP